MNDIELLNATPDEDPILKPSDWLKFRMKKKRMSLEGFPRQIVFSFFPSVYRYLKENYHPIVIDGLNKIHPYYLIEKEGCRIAVQFPGIGAPIAGALMEEAIALGGETFLFFGSTGLLSSEIDRHELIIPDSAIRDEGTSFHYAKPARHARPDQALTEQLEKILKAKGIPFHKGMTWTTDAVYRETPSKIRRLRDEGCLCVDMEAAALFTIARFHQKKTAGLFVPSDRLLDSEWESFSISSTKLAYSPSELLELIMEVFI